MPKFIFHRRFVLVAVVLLLLSACAAPITAPAELPTDSESPSLTAVDLTNGETLHVVATTNIIADVVAQVGGDAIELTGLLPTGADPHGYTLAPQDLRTLNEANVIFINGLELEEAMASTLDNLDGDAPVVSVNQGVETIEFGEEGEHAEDEHAEDEHAEDEDHHHEGADPHTWMSVHNVETWVGPHWSRR